MIKKILRILGIGWAILDKTSKRIFYASIFLFLMTILLRVATPLTFSYLISFTHDTPNELYIVCLAYGFLFLAVRFLEEFWLACYVYFEQVLQKSLILKTLGLYFSIPTPLLLKKMPSEIAIIIDRGLGGIRAALYNSIFALFPLILETFLLIIIIWFKTNIYLAFEIVVILGVFIYSTYSLSTKTRVLQEKWFATASSNYKLLSEGVRSVESLRSFQSTRWMLNRYNNATDKFIAEVKYSLTPGIILGIIQGLLLFILFSSITMAVIISTIGSSQRIASLVLVNGLIIQIALPMLQFSASYRFFIQGISSAKQLFEMWITPQENGKLLHVIENNISGFELSNVKVELQNQRKIHYNKLHIAENEITIINGHSGTGKTTLAKVIAGLLTYTGEIKTNFKPEDIFYLHQQVDIFDISFLENIILGSAFSKKDFDNAVTDSGFTPAELISLSERTLGEMGARVSGGQAQRIGLARMLYHQAKVMIFDEPTTGLDDEAVNTVLESIQIASKGRTVIIVTHDQRVKNIGTAWITLP